MVNSYQNWRYHNIIEAIWLAIRGSHPWPIRGHVKIWKIYMSTLQNLYPLNLAGCLLQEGGSARKPLFVSFYWTFPSSLDLKSILLQISKSASIFVFMWKKICWRFHILTPFLFSHVRYAKSLFTNIQKPQNILKNMSKISLLFKKVTNFTGK